MDEESTAWTQDLRSEEMDWWTCSTYLNAENSPEKTNKKANKYLTTVEMLKDYRGDSSDQDYRGMSQTKTTGRAAQTQTTTTGTGAQIKTTGGTAQSQAPGEC